MTFVERLQAAKIIETQHATSAGVFIPFTALPASFMGLVAIVPISEEEAQTLASSRMAHVT